MHVRDIHALRLKRATTNHETYKSIFEACTKRIRVRASLPNAPTAVFFQVPAVVWGRPPYKHAHAVRYVRDKLAVNGFRVTECDQPGMLVVQWDPRPAEASMRIVPPKKKRGKETTRPRKLSKYLQQLNRAV
jgi:hypothetical protein